MDSLSACVKSNIASWAASELRPVRYPRLRRIRDGMGAAGRRTDSTPIFDSATSYAYYLVYCCAHFTNARHYTKRDTTATAAHRAACFSHTRTCSLTYRLPLHHYRHCAAAPIACARQRAPSWAGDGAGMAGGGNEHGDCKTFTRGGTCRCRHSQPHLPSASRASSHGTPGSLVWTLSMACCAAGAGVIQSHCITRLWRMPSAAF